MEVPNCVYRISVKAVISNDKDQILLIHEKDYGWELPGGGLEHGEDPHKGLAREIEEELGVRVTHVKNKPAAFWTIESPKFVKHFAFVAYETKIEGDFKNSNEAEQIGWFSLEEAKKLPHHENTKNYFLD